MSVQNLALQRNAFVLQNSGLTPRIETLDVVLRQKFDRFIVFDKVFFCLSSEICICLVKP